MTCESLYCTMISSVLFVDQLKILLDQRWMLEIGDKVLTRKSNNSKE